MMPPLWVQRESLLAGALQGKVPGGDALPTLWSVSVEAIQETSEIQIFADINGQITQFVSNG